MSGRSVKHGPRIVEVPSAPLDPAAKKHKEDIDKIQQDITVLSQRIAEAKGELPAIGAAAMTRLPDMSSSSIASSVRGLNDSEKRVRDMKEMKLTTLEQLLERIAEYDRIILSKTIPESIQNQRRKSFGSDLFMLPTHLRVIDRLLDVYTRSQRVQVIKTTVNGSKPPTPFNAHEEGIKLPQLVNLGQESSKNAQLIQQHEQQIEQLNDKIDQAERRHRFSEQQYQDLRVTHSNLEKEHQALRDRINKMERDQALAIQQAKEEAQKAATAAAAQQQHHSAQQQTSQQLLILQTQCQSLQEQLKQKEIELIDKDNLLQKKETFFQSQVKHWQEQEQKYLMEQHEAQSSVSHSEDQYQSLVNQYKQVESQLDIEIQQNSKYIHRLQALISSIQYYHSHTSAMTSPQKPSRASTQPPLVGGSTGNQVSICTFSMPIYLPSSALLLYYRKQISYSSK
jgi:chromosome segregation ATPase